MYNKLNNVIGLIDSMYTTYRKNMIICLLDIS
jgi:hypothetical protein